VVLAIVTDLIKGHNASHHKPVNALMVSFTTFPSEAKISLGVKSRFAGLVYRFHHSVEDPIIGNGIHSNLLQGCTSDQ
jgi:hypothetical protein